MPIIDANGEVIKDEVMGELRALRRENEHLRNVLSGMSPFVGEGRKRRLIWSMTEGHCFYCGDVLMVGDWEIEHRVPLSVGGENDLENLVPACRKCNRTKGTRDTEEFRTYLEEYAALETDDPVVFYGEMDRVELTDDERLEAVAHIHRLLNGPRDPTFRSWGRLAREHQVFLGEKD